MRKRDAHNDPTSCWNKAQDDEPVFILLARDAAAPAAVRAWIEERIRLGKNKHDDSKIVEAEEWAAQVEHDQEHTEGWPKP